MNRTLPKNINEPLLLTLLAAINFVHITDFVIMMPLGPQLMRMFSIDAKRFGIAVAAYTFSAAIVGFLSAFFIDRFDRKIALLTAFAGFIIGTGLCAFAPNFETLVLARVVAGGFGGVLGAQVMAIVGDLIPEERRGRATGVTMMAFSAASVLGIPLGLTLATSFGWHTPFLSLAGLATVIFIATMKVLPATRGHLEHGGVRANAINQVVEILVTPSHLKAFAMIVATMMGGFAIIPFISPYLVGTVGMAEKDLPFIYLAGGISTLVTSRIIGGYADKRGKLKALLVIGSIALIPMFVLTHLPKSPLWLILTTTTAFMIFGNGRMIPMMSIVTSTPKPSLRGGFMSVNSCIQNLSSGLGSVIAGYMITTGPNGEIIGYGNVGIFAIVCAIIAMLVATRIRPQPPQQAVISKTETAA